LSQTTGERAIESIAAENVREADFDREWLSLLLKRALAQLEGENEVWCRCLHAFLVEGRRQSEIATLLGTTESAVRNAVYRGRARLSTILKQEIERYCSSPGEFEDEVRYLQTLLDRGPGKT
jgi:DNA-directed RNA polymerase specialized sigma24 family protein